MEDNFDKTHFTTIEKYVQELKRLYEVYGKEYATIASTILNLDPNRAFQFSDCPQTNFRVNELMQKMLKSMNTLVNNGIEREWNFANLKNDRLVDEIFKTTNLTKSHLNQYTNRNLESLKAFQNRKIDGRKLSDRVWKYTKQFKGEVELYLEVGLGNGESAAALSQRVRNNLDQPNKLFRRVKNNKGELTLSKPAKNYTPEPGVYRSSFKNAMRLTRTEINMAYRASDHERWQQMDFVVGIEVRLSNNPNHCPTCEALAGKYPKQFKFFGWHPQCRCTAISILKTDKERKEDRKLILQGNDPLPDSVNSINDVPDNFKGWLTDNKDRIDRAKSTPYWIRDNFKDGKVDKGLRFKNGDDKE